MLTEHTGTEPTRAHTTDAGYDLTANQETTIPAGTHRLLTTGTSIAIPPGHAAMVCSRSGLALNKAVVVLNAPGIIDSGYRGDVGVMLINHGHQPYTVRPGDKIAQLLIIETANTRFVKVDELPPADRGPNGFGSTGT